MPTDEGCAGIDADGDGVDACTDCDDTLAWRYPGAPETCDGRDEDCDPSTEAEGGETDSDADGSLACDDCDDTDGTVFPGAEEACDGIDQDCDPSTEAEGGEGDDDGDGALACDDCDDSDGSVFPGAVETCDGVDQDCDPGTEAPGGEEDADGDGVRACEDCDDLDPLVFPGNLDPCDGVDNDCDEATCQLAAGEQAAFDWAVSIAGWRCAELADLVAEVEGLAAPSEVDPCPETSSEEDTGPAWFGGCPYSTPCAVCSCTGSSETTTYQGGCTTLAGHDLAGELVIATGWASLSGTPNSEADSGGSLAASGFAQDADSPPDPTRLAGLDGGLTWAIEEMEQELWPDDSCPPDTAYQGGEVTVDCAWSIDLEAEIDGQGTVHLPGGAVGLDLVGTASSHFLDDGCYDGTDRTTRSLVGSATVDGETSWAIQVDLDWTHDSWWGDGCTEEPASGVLTVIVEDDLGPVTLQLTAGGACDGCGRLRRNGAVVATMCGLLAL